MEMVYNIFFLLGGIALFLYGINFMSESLQKAAGDNMRGILQRMTGKGITAVGIGAVVTALIQSSGATSVMVVGFVNAGLMNLVQGIYVMLGANIGTTITAQIIAFKFENIAPLFLFLGMVCYLFIKKKFVKKIGAVILGFGMLFVGIKIMGDAVDELQLSSVISNFLNNYNNPVLTLLFGILITAIIQSSSASVGILQVLAMGGAAGAVSGMTLESVMYMILGMNIGAITPVLLAAFHGNANSKRTALAGLIAKITGALFFGIVIFIFPQTISWIKATSPDLTRQIANFHLVFNVVSSLVLCPFVSQISRLAEHFVKPEAKEAKDAQKLLYINGETLLTPSVAVPQFKREIMRMADLAYENLSLSIDAYFRSDEDKLEEIYERESTINFLNHQIAGGLVQLHGKSLSEKEREKVGMMFGVLTNIERIGDHAENIAEYVEVAGKHTVSMSEEALRELKEMAEKTLYTIKIANEVYDGELFNRLNEVSAAEQAVDDMEEKLNENHIKRLKAGQCSPREGVLFTDMIIDLERCADHAINIAYAIMGEQQLRF